MLSVVLYPCLFALAMSIAPCLAAEEPTPKTPDAAITLFDGKELKGFYTFIKDRGRDTDPKKVFTVKDGLLRISGEEWGCITSQDAYENYRLVVEYTWGDEAFEPRTKNARDSGLVIHSVGADGGYSGTWMHGIECQLIEGGSGDFIVVGDGSDKYAVTSPVAKEKQGSSHLFDPKGESATIHSGRINWWGRDPAWEDTINFRGKQEIEKLPGEWNTMECVADGEDIKVYLNGTLVNHCTKSLPAAGRIQIQSEGAEIFIRKIELQPLKK